jgi:ribosome-associated translation inhibitor RaiA
VYEVRAQLDLPKKVFNAEASATDMHAALDQAKHKLVHLVERYKEQARDKHRPA